MLEKNKPNDNMARVEARTMLNWVSMKPDDDPSVLFEQISHRFRAILVQPIIQFMMVI